MNRIDNNIDSSDSTLPEESEVSFEFGRSRILNYQTNTCR